MSDKTQEVEVTWVHRWTDHLFSFRTTRPAGFRFSPGQFARLGIKAEKSDEAPSIWRAYSLVSGPYDEYLEYYSIVVPDGAFTSRLCTLEPGHTIWMELQNHGFLTLDRFPLEGDLWMLASGTGLAPFLSILADPVAWESFDRLLLIHSVREAQELAYRAQIESLGEHPVFGEWASRLRYQPVVTREKTEYPNERLPALIASGALEASLATELTLARSKLMLCGNPEMVKDTREALQAKGFVSARSSRPGQIATENYW
ncbi:Hmp Flavodoxin reductases (ferredoxin-NADPH reductases) family 1 [Burkholderiales bacterium]